MPAQRKGDHARKGKPVNRGYSGLTARIYHICDIHPMNGPKVFEFRVFSGKQTCAIVFA